MIERVGTLNMYGGATLHAAENALTQVTPRCDLLGLQEWGPNRSDLAHTFLDFRYLKPARDCPPLMYRVTGAGTAYRFRTTRVVLLADGRYVGRLKGRRSRLPDIEAGLYELEDHNREIIAVLNWHLPATVEKGGLYRRLAAVLSPRARMHREARRHGRRLMEAVAKRVDRVYIVGDTNYHDMRLRTFRSCWAGHKLRGTHGKRTIDIVYGLRRSLRVDVVDVPGSDHRGVIARYDV